MRLTGFLILILVALAACGSGSDSLDDMDASVVEAENEPQKTFPDSGLDLEVRAALTAYESWRDEILKGEGALTEDWQKQMRDLWRASQRESDPFLRELGERVAYDQFVRYGDTWSPQGRDAVLNAVGVSLTPEQTEVFGRALLEDWEAIDADNLAWLRDIYETRGTWFSISEFGRVGADNAWTIVQHATDDPFLMARVLSDMEFMVQEGEADPSKFALLYDRVHMNAGKPQRYGTQFTCRDGRIQPHAIEDEFDLDARRKSVGLEPMADYAARFAGQTC